MVTFGATYGSIVLARISLLVGRAASVMDYNLPKPRLSCLRVRSPRSGRFADLALEVLPLPEEEER